MEGIKIIGLYKEILWYLAAFEKLDTANFEDPIRLGILV